MDKRLTPEQLVKELRDIADGLKSDGYDVSAKHVKQAADLIESQSKQLDVAAEDWNLYMQCDVCPHESICQGACGANIRPRWAEEAAKR